MSTVTHESILVDMEREITRAVRKAFRRLDELEGPDPGRADKVRSQVIVADVGERDLHEFGRPLEGGRH